MTRSFLPARLGATWVLFDAMSVQEIMGAIPALRLPRSHGAIPSVVAWRARAVPVVDLGFLVASLASTEQRTRMLILKAGDSMVAVPVDAAAEVVQLGADEMRSPHATSVNLAVAEADVGGQLMAVLDMNALLGRLLGDATEDHRDNAAV